MNGLAPNMDFSYLLLKIIIYSVFDIDWQTIHNLILICSVLFSFHLSEVYELLDKEKAKIMQKEIFQPEFV